MQPMHPLFVNRLGWGLVFAGMALVTNSGAQAVRVSAGEPNSRGALIWVQLASPGIAVAEISTSPAFSTVVQRISQSMSGSLSTNGKIRVSSLQPNTVYYYRVTNPLGNRASGRFKTLPAPGSAVPLRFGVSGDTHNSLPPYPALKNVGERQLDFFALIGDTTYGDSGTPAQTVEQYRAKYEQVLSTQLGTNFLVLARAATNWLATIDDHEVVNDFAGGSTSGTGFFNQTARYKAGMQAFFEYHPLEVTGWPDGSEARVQATPRCYRRYDLGRNATYIQTDLRSYRDSAITGSTDSAFLTASFDALRTMMSETQLQRLMQDLRDAQGQGVIWKFVMSSDPIQNLGVRGGAGDKWDGYLYERNRLLRMIHTEGIQNVVFVSADIHGTLVNDLSYSDGPGMPQTRTRAWDMSTGPVAFYNTYGPNLQSTAVSSGYSGAVSNTVYNSYTAAQKETYIQQLLNVNKLAPVGYDPIGLQGSLIQANLTAGSYSATHSYSWTEFEIGASGAAVTVTTWGTPTYSSSFVASNPQVVTGYVPQIVQQFTVQAEPIAPRPGRPR